MLLTGDGRGSSGGRRSPGGRLARTVLLVLLVANAGWALGASAAPADNADRPEPALAQLRTTPPIYRLVYTRSSADERIDTAQQRLVGLCMGRLGFTYTAPPPAAAGQPAEGPRPFGLESLDSPDTGEAPAVREEQRPDAAAYTRALYGDPKKRLVGRGKWLSASRPGAGCLAEAEQRLMGDARQRWIQLRVLLFEAEQRSRDLLDRDAEFQAANREWQRCMQRTGITASDPLRLLAALPAGSDVRTHPATRADTRCKTSTGYLRIAYTRLAVVQTEVLGADPSIVRDWRRILARQDAAARAALGDR
ncbi:hypothetical protein [Micromonospora sp. NPDC004551]|uniref:hypothetical protein n=1 Tax=Micromonospora sp. NPDC004551 TaxID=3154284 RepID=UPI0033B01AA6